MPTKNTDEARQAVQDAEIHKYGYFTIQTGVPEIVVQVFPNGSHRLADLSRNKVGDTVSYRTPVSLICPEEVQHNARWMWFSEYWSGLFPVEKLCIMTEY